jgi:hypothetical protein
MKRPARPLLNSQQPDRKGKGKARQQQQDSANNDEQAGIYSYTTAKKGKGVARAQQRLKGAREDVSESYNAGPSNSSSRRGKHDDEDDLDEDNEVDSFAGADDFSKYKDVKFKIGMDSDDEAPPTGGQFDDDEEIDSDLAGSDDDSESDKRKNKNKNKKTKSNKRSVSRPDGSLLCIRY